MGRVIAVVNQKGGVGKTTTAVNLASWLARKGKFVLLIDMDPQANATSGVGIPHEQVTRSVYHVLVGQAYLRDVVMDTTIEGLRIVPAQQDLAGASVELVNLEQREYRLRQAVTELASQYDYVFIDCPPSLGLLTINGLVAANEVFIPVQCEYYALEGLGQLLSTVELVREHLHPELKILGAVLTMYDRRNNLSDEVLHQIHQYFPNKVFRSVIPRNIKLAEAPSHGKPISEYDPRSKGGRAYESLAQEIIDLEQSWH